MINYQYILNPDGVTVNQTVIKRLPDMANIPFDPENTDYQQYLKWVALGNSPLPADEGAI
jgi:hypothetical protein